MKSYKITVGTSAYRSESITLGQVGENLAREIVFDCTAFERLYGDGTAKVIAELPTGVKYPVTVEQEGAIVRWKVQAADVGVKGSGHAELQWIVNEVIAKTQIFSTRIRESLTGTDVPEPPDPYKDWFDRLMELEEHANQNVEAAARSAQEAAEAAEEAAFSADTHPYIQQVASDNWTIEHGLGKYPSVTIVDSAGSVVIGEVTYNDKNSISIQFSGAFSGTAYLN